MFTFLILIIVVAIGVLFGVRDVRRKYITQPVFVFFKKVLPPITETEKEAMEAGDVWWDAELFSGKPDWKKLHNFSKPALTIEEQSFLDNEVETLLAMLNDYEIVHKYNDLPENVWQYLRKNGFFALIIPKKFGGKAFSAYANSTIVTRIGTRSTTAAITVMVPNSLGPGELLTHYGTVEQQEFWLPKLASGDELPCFALTGPEAGSDAGSIPDIGIVCKGKYNDEEVLGISISWNKRYITLAPVATVLGLAFKLRDPDGLLGEVVDIGITCALIPTSHPGVKIGDRHNPLNLAFMNGTTEGSKVFIPMSWVIGGQDFVGKGWRMLVECLSAGRGISLPGMSTATGHLSARMTSAYATVRQQFGLSIAKFEGVQEALGRIGGNTYALEAMRRFTVGAIDLGLSPSVITAIAKYHMTEMSRDVVNDAMDIHAGKGIQLGPKNYLGHAYMGQPIAITVEGANILTRNLMIFGQGATRCHPFVLKEMAAAAHPDQHQGFKDFDHLLVSHILFSASNGFMSLLNALTFSYFNSVPVSGETARYYQHLTRFSRSFAWCTDIAMLTLGGDLKRKEMLSARLGDVLSHLCIASAVLKHFEDEGRQQADLPFVDFCLQRCLFNIAQAFDGFISNFPNKIAAWACQLIVFPLGNHFKLPKDETLQDICYQMTLPGIARDRLTHLCYVGKGKDDVTGVVDKAFELFHLTSDIRDKLNKAVKNGELTASNKLNLLIDEALKLSIISEKEGKLLKEFEVYRLKTINVDVFPAK